MFSLLNSRALATERDWGSFSNSADRVRPNVDSIATQNLTNSSSKSAERIVGLPVFAPRIGYHSFPELYALR